MLLSTDILFEQLILQFTMDLLYIHILDYG